MADERDATRVDEPPDLGGADATRIVDAEDGAASGEAGAGRAGATPALGAQPPPLNEAGATRVVESAEAEAGEGGATRVVESAAATEGEPDATRIVSSAPEGESPAAPPMMNPVASAAPVSSAAPAAAPPAAARAAAPAAARTAAPAAAPAQPASATLSERSRRRRTRERDARAERVAQRLVLLLFLGVGGVALVIVNSGADTPPPSPSPTAPTVAKSNAPPRRARPTAPRLSAAPIESPAIPALGGLQREGLTIVAEGLPEVLAISPDNPPAILAGIESCRFAYSIWEFSPNKRFKFMTTCAQLEGETLAGAWELDGATIRLSPLTSGPTTLTSLFQVERPSSMKTSVVIAGPRPVHLQVKQRVTGMRQGMDGDGWRRAYLHRNTVRVRGPGAPSRANAPSRAPSGGAGQSGGTGGTGVQRAPRRQTPPVAPTGTRDPVLELLQRPR